MTLTLPRPKTYNETRITSPKAREQMHALLDEYTDAQVAQAIPTAARLRKMLGFRTVTEP